jgi:hypothetical protein
MHIREIVVHFICAALLVLSLSSCSRTPAPPPEADAATRAANDAQSRVKAIAKGAAAARAYAHSRGLDSAPSPSQEAVLPAVRTFVHEDYAELDWLKMMPPEDLEALQRGDVVEHVGNTRMAQSGTFKTVADVTGRKIKLPGYVVPIETDDRGRMTEFFFVPFFGACIHVPPPPPNQLVHAVLAKPMPTPQISDPYWLRGELRIETVKNKVAGSAYSMSDAVLLPMEN